MTFSLAHLPAFLSLLLALMVPAVLSPALADTPVQVEVELEYRYDLARPMLDLINDFRAGSEAWAWSPDDSEQVYYDNLKPLEYDYGLEQVAMQRAAECAVHYDHTRPDGTSCFTVYPSAGCGENIAAGYRTTKAVFTAWQEDDEPFGGQGHRRNMLSRSLGYIGIGCVYADGTYYWCQAFCSRATCESGTALTGPAIVDATVEMLRADGMTDLCAEVEVLKIPEGGTEGLPAVTGRSGGWGRIRMTVLDPPWVPDNSSIISVDGGFLTAVTPGITTLTVDIGETLDLDAVSLSRKQIRNESTCR